MSEAKKIIHNVTVTYGRSLVALLCGLFSARWVLKALGNSDFGLYGVVGSVICFITYLNLVLSTAVARFYSYQIGKEEVREDGSLKDWFTTAVILHLVLGGVLVVVGYPIGLMVIEHGLVIPPERMEACVVVFRIALGSAFVSVVSVPWLAMFTAQQRLSEAALFDLVRVFAIFAGAWWLLRAPGDRLVLYAWLVAVSTILAIILQMLRAHVMFSVCRLSSSAFRSWSRFAQIGRFAACQMLGIGGWLGQKQGSAVLVNLGFGPSFNASFSVGMQVTSQTSGLAVALLNSLTPAVTATAGAGDLKRFAVYARAASRFAGLLEVLLAVPLICEADYLLRFWLGTPPLFAAGICIGFILADWVDSLATGYSIALSASGKIGRWQVCEALVRLASLPVLWGCYKLGLGFLSVGFVFVGSAAFVAAVRLLFARHFLGFRLGDWLHEVAIPGCSVMALALSGAIVARWLMPEGVIRLICVASVSSLIVVSVGWFKGLLPNERNHVKGWMKRRFA